MKQLSKAVLSAALFLSPFSGCSQQRADHDFVAVIDTPLFEPDKGPVMLVDGGHHNFHTLEGRFAPFGKIAEMEGFRVRSIQGKIENGLLKEGGILVIANALNERNVNSWRLPVLPAFTKEEVLQISNWVHNGGRLLLIADHMPFSGAAAGLARSMGFTMYNGFALRRPGVRFDVFSRGNGMLKHGVITDLHGALDSIVSFTGQAFNIPDHATSVITLDSNYKILMPEAAWEFSRDTRMIPARGLSQLAYCRYGSGKIVVAGEAAMFTAQRAGNMKFGFNASFAPYNLPLLLNILEWLSN